jgi:hypothetical protein
MLYRRLLRIKRLAGLRLRLLRGAGSSAAAARHGIVRHDTSAEVMKNLRWAAELVP